VLPQKANQGVRDSGTRASKIDHKTIALIVKGKAVKPRTRRDVIRFLENERKKDEIKNYKSSTLFIHNGDLVYFEFANFSLTVLNIAI
jgi:hypothetical protein